MLAILLLALAALQYHWLEQWALRDAESRQVALATLAQGLVAAVDAEVAQELDALRAVASAAADVPLGGALAGLVDQQDARVWWVARDPRRSARPIWRLQHRPRAHFAQVGLAELLQRGGNWSQRVIGGIGVSESDGSAPLLVLDQMGRSDGPDGEAGFLVMSLSAEQLRSVLRRALRQSERSRAGAISARLLPSSEAVGGTALPSPQRFAGQPAAGYWRLQLDYAEGTASELAGQLQRRHLLLAGSILLLLGASSALLAVAAYRRRRLAEQRLLMIATVSHELRTPLAVIDSAAANLAEGIAAEPAQVREYGGLIRSEAQRLRDWVEQALAPGVLAPQPRPGSAASGSAFGPTLQRTLATSDDQHRINADLADCATVVVAMPEADLELVIGNLSSNALRYADAGSEVRVQARRQGNRLQIEWRNQCSSLQPGEREHLLEPFFRSEQARRQHRQGSGLGLSLVKAALDRCGGRLRMRFDATQVKVRVILPLVR
jgi:signal transduction histidine kinase